MIAANNKVLVSVNLSQKNSIKIGDLLFASATNFEINYREKSPTIATVLKGDGNVAEGDILLCHHNSFYLPSPYHIEGEIFAIPSVPEILFAKILADGSLEPILDNIIVELLKIPSLLPVAPEKQKTYTDRAIVKNGGTTKYKPGDIIFHRPYASYNIVYNLNGIENRVAKVPAAQVCGFVRKK